MLRKTLVLALASALLPLGCSRETPGPDWSAVDSVLTAAVESQQVPAVVAMVGTSEDMVYQGAAGLPPDAIVAIASMTKPVTAVAAMQLIEAGKIGLDEPVQTYLPELGTIQVYEGGHLRDPKSPPTVRQLLSHTSGFAYEFLNRDIADLVKSGRLPTVFTGGDEFLAAPLVFDPGTRWAYGISTDWLGRLVEAVSGQTLDAYFREHIFQPLGMTETFFEVPAELVPRLAPQHVRQPDGSLAVVPQAPPAPVTFYSGGGGLHSTAADYLRFARAVLAGGTLDGQRILRSETVVLMGENQIGEEGLPPIQTMNPQLVDPAVALPGGADGFGLGFALNRRPLDSGRGRGAMSWAGIYNTFFWIDREKDICAVLLVQMLPFGDPGPIKLMEDFDRAVYRVVGPS